MPLMVDTSLPNGLDIEFTVNQPNTATLSPFVFQAHPMFPTTIDLPTVKDFYLTQFRRHLTEFGA